MFFSSVLFAYFAKVIHAVQKKNFIPFVGNGYKCCIIVISNQYQKKWKKKN